ncbi:MAG TPA: sialidase family protein [Mycobacteriales bacterium]|nr:sialidase family protein [Mycobacteriales bacterium]
MRARRRFLLLAGVVALDVVLVFVALRPRPASDVAQAVTTATPSAERSAQSAPRGDTGSTTRPDRALLADVTGATALRVTSAGTCSGGGAAVELSTDEGTSWTALDLPVEAVFRVRVTGAGSGAVVGAGRDCRPVLYSTEDAGASWSGPGTTDGTWHRYLPAADRLHAPSRDVAVPCGQGVALVDLAPATVSTATILCADGAIQRTADAGATWERQGALPGAASINQGSARTLFAAVSGQDGCAGVGIQTSTDGGARWTVTGCAADATARDGVALTFTDADRGLLVTADRAYRTGDGGKVWAAA